MGGVECTRFELYVCLRVSFNQSFAAWNASNETDIRGIFTGADALFEVQVQVQHANWPDETGWTLRDSTGTVLSSQSVGSFNTEYGAIAGASLVTFGTYTFEMTDTEEDCICCTYGSGSFSIAVNGETAISNEGRFNDSVTETFEVRVPTPSHFLVFETREELREAVDWYLANNCKITLVSRNYGWPIGVWDVSKIQDFSYLFSADESVVLERFNPAAATFNEDISRWEVLSATTMTSMFAGARSFDQPIGNWNVSSVTDMSFLFARATSFNEPLGDWHVSSVTSMRSMFNHATSFIWPLRDWEVSSVRDMSYMFAYAFSLMSRMKRP
jgi:surface protein